jgi:hypothetical protein
MTQTALTVLIVAIVAVIVIAAIVVVASRSRRSRLHELPPESKERYARMWHNVEARFVENPAEAVREADRAAVGVLSERGATLHDERSVPDELPKARESAASDRGRQGTEGMRQAMVYYKHIVEDAVGDTSRTGEAYKREVAS